MKTAFEAALERSGEYLRRNCPVPLMTHPLSQHWNQPDPAEWIFTETEVLMPKADFERLLDYSHSQPTGVYEGKMWRTSDDQKTWHLHFWSQSDKPNHCKGNVRTIVVL